MYATTERHATTTNPDALAIASALADLLGLTLTRSNTHHTAFSFAGVDGFTFTARTHRGTGGARLVAHESTPDTPPHPDGSHRRCNVYWRGELADLRDAGVSLSRDPGRAAADLARRIAEWPRRYAQRAEIVTDRAAQEDQDRRAVLGAIDRLGMTPAHSFSGSTNETPESASLGRYAGHADLYAEARFYYHDGFALRLSLERLSVEEARAALDAVQTLRAA